MKKSKPIEKLIDHFGTQAKTAKALQVEQPTVSNWLRGIHGVSVEHALRAELATGGAVKAVDLCPKLAGLYGDAGPPDDAGIRKAS